MPIEIKEITIKADVYPQKKAGGQGAAGLSAFDREQLKKELAKEVLQAVLQKINQSTER